MVQSVSFGLSDVAHPLSSKPYPSHWFDWIVVKKEKMDPANRIGGAAPAQATSVPMPDAVAAPTVASGFNPVALMLPMVTGKFSEWKDERMKSLRPMGSFLSRDKLSFPAPTELASRVKTNLLYFQTNYFVLFAVLGLYCVYVH